MRTCVLEVSRRPWAGGWVVVHVETRDVPSLIVEMDNPCLLSAAGVQSETAAISCLSPMLDSIGPFTNTSGR